MGSKGKSESNTKKVSEIRSGGSETNLDVSTRAWHDSDDERIEVNISDVSKLRKLRKVENEGALGGKEYSLRLREFHKNRVHNLKISEWIERARKAVSRGEIGKTDLEHDFAETENKSAGETKGDVDEGFSLASFKGGIRTTEVKSGKIYKYIEGARGTLSSNIESQETNRKGSKRMHFNHSKIDISRLANANIQSPSDCVVKSLEFHKGQMMGSSGLKSCLLSVSGWDKKIKLFSVDGVDNKLISSLYFENFPIYESKFTNKTEEMLFLGPNSRIGVYDLLEGRIDFIPGIAGRKDKRYWNLTVQGGEDKSKPYIAFSTSNGCILVLDEITKQLVRSFVMNDSVTGLTFHPDDDNKLISSSNTGEIYIWDINTGRCRERIMDHGSLCISRIVSSSYKDKVTGEKKSFILTGSSTGYVNIYQKTTYNGDVDSTNYYFRNSHQDRVCKSSLFETPKYIISNLCTSITSMAVHPKNEVAAISSKWSKDSLKLINLNTGKVFSNWPSIRTPLKYVTSLDFSEKGGFFAVGNDKGDILLYRLNSYI
ncbi:WD40 repeat protein [Cryptosporidium ryanae]|uniref:WD40 repeat protein n=1 Tax=Cryptosporidium ryanae TaxID=515981 RepID=UPI00351A4AB2|nr:WD40 repeat protein [Cryptosporidium ryanae]